MANEQASSWTQLKVHVNRLNKTFTEMPAPPIPDDDWSQKLNNLNRGLDALNQQLNTRIEMEDAQLEVEEEG